MIPFAIILTIALGFRLALTLAHDGFLGVDGGAYFLNVNAVLGDEPTGAGFPRPPLAPGWLLVPFLDVFGPDNGYKIWSALVSITPAVPIYLMARSIWAAWAISKTTTNRPLRLPLWLPGVAAAAFVLLDFLHAEMMVTGALPLLAFALLGMVWWGMGELLHRRSWPVAAIVAACIGLIPWINQTTAGLALITIPVYGAALIYYNRCRQHTTINHSPSCFGAPPYWRTITPPLLLGGVIALCALPWYMTVLPVTGVLNYPGAFMYPNHWTDSSWLQMVLGGGAGAYVIYRAREPWLRSLGVLLVLFAFLVIWLSTDETVINIFYRSRYLMAVPFYVVVTWAVFTRWLPSWPRNGQRAAMAAAVVTAGILVAGYISQFDRQTDYSDMATPETVQALEMLRGQDDNAGVINNSFTLSL